MPMHHESPKTASRIMLSPTVPAEEDRILDGKYRLMHRLDQTGVGRVYTASYLDRYTVVVKLCGKHPDTGGTLRQYDQRFDHECRVLESLTHPSLSRTLSHGYDREDDVRYIVEQRVRGVGVDELRTVLGRALTPSEAAAVLLPIADALVHCHVHGVYHGRLKSRHIRITSESAAGPSVLVGLRPRDAGLGIVPGASTTAEIVPEELDAGAVSDVVALAEIAYLLTSGCGPRSLGLSPSQRNGETSIDTTDARWNGILDMVLRGAGQLRMRGFRDLLVSLVLLDPVDYVSMTEIIRDRIAEEPTEALPTIIEGPPIDRPRRPIGALPPELTPIPAPRTGLPVVATLWSSATGVAAAAAVFLLGVLGATTGWPS